MMSPHFFTATKKRISWQLEPHCLLIAPVEKSVTILPTPTRRYMLGVYEVMAAVTDRFPAITFESCSSGGGRTDPDPGPL